MAIFTHFECKARSYYVLNSSNLVFLISKNTMKQTVTIIAFEVCPVHYWVSCANNKRCFLRLHFRRRQTFASLWGACLRFASLWRANSCRDSCVLGVHLSKVCWGLIFCLRKAFIFQKFALKFYFGLSLHIFQHGSSLSLENVCDSWCMHQIGFSSAAVVPTKQIYRFV